MNKKLSKERAVELIEILRLRFEANPNRHSTIAWSDVEKRLSQIDGGLWSLNEMEETEGEPDVIGMDEKTGRYIFVDCAKESPKGRRSICYDHEALEARKLNKPQNSAVNMAQNMGVELLDEAWYQALQQLGPFDTKTSSWLATPKDVRSKGGAIFGDWRFGRVFVYHNGADSYYAARGFRAICRI